MQSRGLRQYTGGMSEAFDEAVPPPRRSHPRRPAESFELPANRLAAGYYTDKYFLNTRAVLLAENDRRRVTMQVFQKKHALLAGMDAAIATLKRCLTDGFTWQDLEVHALHDGDTIEPLETVLTINGPYAAFAHLETVYLGVLARATRIATNTRAVVEAAWPKPVIFFPARFDHWSVQSIDGYAAYIAGASGVSTDAQGEWYGGEGVGTVPHGLIASMGGDTVAAARAFAKHITDGQRIIVLVDFENDSVTTALAVARALGPQLYGVRLDTSETMVDRSIAPETDGSMPAGVNPQLVRNVRAALDSAGFQNVKITASGGFDTQKIRLFAEQNVPVDSYGVGSSLLRNSNDFTADVVLLDGRPAAKVGRGHRPNPRLERVD